ncbi:PIN-like domain-containing protein [Nonomuraea dietziae]|uniref:PIN-like domain-containing protein n=1 Tax=Nonomuraea dietziae TaxID=65515 RepID=UPI0033F73850
MGGKVQTKKAGLYDGFEGYRTPSDRDLKRVLTRGLVALDANVLLNLYRYTSSTRADLFGVLARLGDRLWIPHQALVEFWRNRDSTIRDPRTTGEKAIVDLETKWNESLAVIRTWSNRIALSEVITTELGNMLDDAFVAVSKRIKDVMDKESSELSRVTHEDPVLGGLESIIEGRRGEPFPPGLHQKLVQEALSRIEKQVPPGYKDKGKSNSGGDDRATGDFILWEQVLREAATRKTDVLFVTGDVKEDWWRKEHGEARGPRLELVQEMKDRTGQGLLMLRPESLLVHAKKLLAVDVSDASVEDVNRVGAYLSREAREEWSAEDMEDQDDFLTGPDERYLLDKLPEGRSGNYLDIVSDMASLVKEAPDLDSYLDAFQKRFPSITLRTVARRRMRVLVSLGLAHIQGGQVGLTPLGERFVEERSLSILQQSVLRRVAGAAEIAELVQSTRPADVRSRLSNEPPAGLSVTQALLVLRWLVQLEIVHAG